jgi:hypothetical protein
MEIPILSSYISQQMERVQEEKIGDYALRGRKRGKDDLI